MKNFDVQEIEDLLAAGMSTRELAVRLGVDRKTIYYKKVNDPGWKLAFENAEIRRQAGTAQTILDLLDEIRRELDSLKQEILGVAA